VIEFPAGNADNAGDNPSKKQTQIMLISVTVPTVERGFLETVFCSMEIAGDKP
jgi:hypothetical protein